jgi:hypothetical protein
MIVLDSMMVSSLRWILGAIGEAVMAELDDDTALREALVDAAVRHEAGALSDEEFADLEESLLSRINEIRAGRGAVAGPIALVPSAQGAAAESVQVEASILGDFNEAPPADER